MRRFLRAPFFFAKKPIPNTSPFPEVRKKTENGCKPHGRGAVAFWLQSLTSAVIRHFRVCFSDFDLKQGPPTVQFIAKYCLAAMNVFACGRIQ
jgi:hypothetical protein